MKTASLIFLCLSVSCIALPEDLDLAKDGATPYQIVKSDDASPVDEYAAGKLAEYLKQITGVEFAVVGPKKMDEGPSIFVGLSGPAVKLLGEDAGAGLKDQEHVSRSIGKSIFLFGKGVHGNLHAVMEFLENSMGCRWYSVFGKPVTPSKPTVRLKPFNRRRGFSFASRQVGIRYGLEFYYQNGINMGFYNKNRKLKRRNLPFNKGMVDYLSNEKFVHSSFAYIPPAPGTKYSETFDWLERKNYFETSPDFFSQDHTGRRVKNRQLCFSNPELRQELTRNILRRISVSPDSDIITVDAADAPDRFCYCSPCKALEKKYQSAGGPIYDYLIELCGLLQTRHPRIMVKTLAYRRSQTQKPPVLPEGGMLPDNLIVSFAPIEDSYFADWSHPDPRFQETYSDLAAWRKVTKHLWAWLYPNPWGSGATMPVGNVHRLITNMRLMHEQGVTGVFTDHNGFNERAGWSELQSYVLYKLMQDISTSADGAIQEFTDHQYGSAAPGMRLYLGELESGRKDMKVLPPGTTYRSSNYDDRTFPYLTVDNIYRWQQLFDEMEQKTARHAEHLLNVRTVRRELDFATLWKWFEIRKQHPGYFKDYRTHVQRITSVNESKTPPGMKPRPLGKSALDDFVAVIQGGGQEKPLPSKFDGIDKSRIRTFIPTNKARRAKKKRVIDPDAASGFAATVHLQDLPFQFGFFQWKTRQPPTGNHGPRRSLNLKEITPGSYRLYKLGTITVTPDSLIWFSAKSWLTNLNAGKRLFEPGAENQWVSWISLKFDGPSYRGKTEKDLVLCDRIILVRKET